MRAPLEKHDDESARRKAWQWSIMMPFETMLAEGTRAQRRSARVHAYPTLYFCRSRVQGGSCPIAARCACCTAVHWSPCVSGPGNIVTPPTYVCHKHYWTLPLPRNKTLPLKSRIAIRGACIGLLVRAVFLTPRPGHPDC